MRERLITKYHETLTADDSLTAEFFAHLRNEMRTRRLFYGHREISAALRPHLLTQTQYNILADSAQVLPGAFETIAAALMSESQFVLKPNDDYGGRGISFGENATASKWESALSEALSGDYVVQEKIELRKEGFPMFRRKPLGFAADVR